MKSTDLEVKVIKRFVAKGKRDRFLNFVSSEKNRNKFIIELAHFNDFDSGLFEEVKGDEIVFIKTKIKFLGSVTECYLISENKEIDGQILDVDEAFSKTIGFGMGTIIVFGEAEMIFYEGEGPRDRWISKRVI